NGEPVVCARTVNLVVYSGNAQDQQHVAELLDAIMSEHPGRAILISPAAEDTPTELRAQVSASCALSHVGRRYIGQERIEIAAKASAHDRLPSFVTALLVPDVPVFLWWREL